MSKSIGLWEKGLTQMKVSQDTEMKPTPLSFQTLGLIAGPWFSLALPTCLFSAAFTLTLGDWGCFLTFHKGSKSLGEQSAEKQGE
jgi:hypothetical protein